MRKVLVPWIRLGFVLGLVALAGAVAAKPAASQNCGIGFRCCPRLGHCLCWPDHEVCPP